MLKKISSGIAMATIGTATAGITMSSPEQRQKMNLVVSDLVNHNHESRLVKMGLNLAGRCRMIALEHGPSAVEIKPLFFDQFPALPVFRGDARENVTVHFPPFFSSQSFHGDGIFNKPGLPSEEKGHCMAGSSGLTCTSLDPVTSLHFTAGGEFGVYTVKPEESVVLSRYTHLNGEFKKPGCGYEYEIAHTHGLTLNDLLFSIKVPDNAPIEDLISTEDCDRMGISHDFEFQMAWPTNLRLGLGKATKDEELKKTPITKQVLDVITIICDEKSKIPSEAKKDLLFLKARWLQQHSGNTPIDGKQFYENDIAKDVAEYKARLTARTANRNLLSFNSIPALSC